MGKAKEKGRVCDKQRKQVQVNEGKRKKVVVTLQQKLEALKRIEAGESSKKVAADLGVGKSTITDWKNKRADLEKYVSQQTPGSSRKSMKKGSYAEVEAALFLWHSQARAKGFPITGPILQTKAEFFYEKIEGKIKDFSENHGWLSRFKQRYGIRQVGIAGELLSGDERALPDFKDKLHTFIDEEGLSAEQIYNCDEFGLNFKMLPGKTLASQEEKKTPGYKRSKERVTGLVCSNALGNHKLRLTLIGKSLMYIDSNLRGKTFFFEN